MEKIIILNQRGRDAHYKLWHTIGKNMILYVHSGEGSIVCTEKVYPLKEGTLCFVGASKYHYTMPYDFDSYERSKIFVFSEKLKNISELLPESMSPLNRFSEDSLLCVQIDERDRTEVEKIFSSLAEDACSRYFEAELHSAFLKLLCFIDRNSISVTPFSLKERYLPIEYINRHICEELSIDSICLALHVSKYHFCRQFKKTSGMTVMEYILRTRIVMAENMLLNGDDSITDISYACGFSSTAYFSRVFKEKTGQTPLAYRKYRKIK